MAVYEFKVMNMPLSAGFAFAPWLKEIEKHTDRKVKFKFLDETGEMGEGIIQQGSDLLRIIREGKLDIGPFMTSYHSDTFPLSGIFGIPFLYTTTEAAAAVGWELLDKYMADTEYKVVKPLWLSVPGILQMHFARRPVRKLEDLKHMKMNVHGIMPPAAFRALGGDPVETEDFETKSFLKRGFLDGLVTNWISNLPVADLAKYSIGNGYVWSTGIPYVMNLDTWNKLPPDIQKVFTETSGLNLSRAVGAEFDKRDTESFEKYKKSGHDIYMLPAEERARWVAAVQPVVDEWAKSMEARGLQGKAIVEDARKLVKKYSK